ncbi:methyltransferase-domain-containing protein [Mucor mucedo]|uniref:methyltransferase-domain-containing protein n=1 Tax=Mucor mucedo TaxID=29922 RepID=UPI00221EC452|nr:methyltransferase-domain-containing protein [Mucor mucedo]KAI7892481.1 methyltransferase-domain-containing protein [Mucor mucedo]
MFFETSGWALPKNIASEKKEVISKKEKFAQSKLPKEGKLSREADQIQAQMASLNDQPILTAAEPKTKKPRVRNKKRALEETPVEEKVIEKPVETNKKQKKNKPVVKQQPEPVDSKKTQQKKKLQQLLSKKDNNNNGKKADKKVEKKAEKKANTSVVEVVKAKPQPIQKVEEDDGLTPLQRKMKEKLSGARFRWLNEQLYTTPGQHSFDLFQEKPELFDQYHEGFRHQVESWPVNPVDVIIDQLKSLPKGTLIADLGCGDAMIAQSLTKQTVLSFDLIAKNDLVTACDITKLPLEANSIDVAVFSLSLMGTNYLDFLKEAHRVLKIGGELKIAEVVSRFSDLDSFIGLLESLGFDFMDKEDDNKMFVMLYFTKQPNFEEDENEEMFSGLSKTQKRSLKKGAGINNSKIKLQKKSQQLLKPCLYKKR